MSVVHGSRSPSSSPARGQAADSAVGPRAPVVDNELYDHLGDRWYTADDDPVALLRAAARVKGPWVRERIDRRHPLAGFAPRTDSPSSETPIRTRSDQAPVRVLDVGCGAGFLANALAEDPTLRVTGLDASDESLVVARRHDRSGHARYVKGDALSLPFADGSFDVVCAMDLLEHVERPRKVVREAARVLAPGGLFFFHTFNRTRRADWLVIRGLQWAFPRAPEHLHVLHLFVRPEELREACMDAGLCVDEMVGLAPVVWSRAMLRLLLERRVDADFPFRISPRLWGGYLGMASAPTCVAGPRR